MASVRTGVLVAILTGALVFAGWGMTSLAIDRDVVPEEGTATLVGPAMLVATMVVAGIGAARESARARATRHVSWAGSAGWAVVAWFAFSLTALAGATLGGLPVEAGTPVGFALRHATDAFALVVVLAVFGCVAGAAVLARSGTDTSDRT
ncbi:hypothetical protein F8O01_02045 [Pseudoclavibacter chungangensis]|uniref:Uncharacterized protein n=1 Tax=Pseudoclavibacter chungangensis TaxID=587635 RepID=A0A7J5C188_9MICO|nr:hypothetical protein [Pseudoclavibacter chungangensis]KAB1662263.1 hypothetical protein F8O01_02045 [Pseudoclavibacter chungangensis]NYJ65469.1 hypothetical protein [Pseudoclavibacter chungangensis]